MTTLELTGRETVLAPRVSATARDAMRSAVNDVAPILVAIAPLALIIGATIAQSNVANWAGWSGSILIWAGAAHLATVGMIDSEASLAVLLLTVAVINGRFIFYSAALSEHFRHQPRWFRIVAPHFLVDQLFAIVWDQLEEVRDHDWVRWYYFAAAAAIGAVWLPTIAAGVFLGPVIPASWPLSFAVPVMFIGLLVPSLKSRTDLLTVIAAATTAVAASGLPMGSGLIAGAVAGLLVSSLLRRSAS